MSNPPSGCVRTEYRTLTPTTRRLESSLACGVLRFILATGAVKKRTERSYGLAQWLRLTHIAAVLTKTGAGISVRLVGLEIPTGKPKATKKVPASKATTPTPTKRVNKPVEPTTEKVA